MQQLLNPFKAKEPAIGVPGLYDAVRYQHQPVALVEPEVVHGKLGCREHAQRQSAFHLHRCSVQIGRHVPGIGQRGLAVGVNVKRQAGGLGVVAAQQPQVQLVQHRPGIGAQAGRGTDGSHQQRHQDACLQTPSVYIAGHNQQAAVRPVGNDLEEIAAHFTGRPVLALDHHPGNRGSRFGQNHLPHFLGLLHVQSHLPLTANRVQQPALQKNHDHQHQEQIRDLAEPDAPTEDPPPDRDMETGKLRG